jgi:Sulfotransferase family
MSIHMMWRKHSLDLGDGVSGNDSLQGRDNANPCNTHVSINRYQNSSVKVNIRLRLRDGLGFSTWEGVKAPRAIFDRREIGHLAHAPESYADYSLTLAKELSAYGRNTVVRNSQSPIAETSIKSPNFLVIGGAKSGTSALWHYLKQHPQVYVVPRKHTRFFAYDVEYPDFRGPAPRDPGTPYSVVNAQDYHALFDGVTSEKAIGEVSWTYLYRPEAPGRIKEYAPHIKLIAVLRHPTDRAYSHYMQNVKAGREQIPDFIQALEAEEVRVRDGWWPEFHYVQVGLYAAQLMRYIELFDCDQIRVYLHEDFEADPSRFLRDVLQFLDVEDSFTPEAFTRYNSAATPKNKALHVFLQSMKAIRPAVEQFIPKEQRQRVVRIGSSLHKRNLVRPELSQRLRKRVTEEYFRDDILRTQDLLGRDLTSWLN